MLRLTTPLIQQAAKHTANHHLMYIIPLETNDSNSVQQAWCSGACARVSQGKRPHGTFPRKQSFCSMGMGDGPAYGDTAGHSALCRLPVLATEEPNNCSGCRHHSYNEAKPFKTAERCHLHSTLHPECKHTADISRSNAAFSINIPVSQEICWDTPKRTIFTAPCT